jgi:uncharacterized protein
MEEEAWRHFTEGSELFEAGERSRSLKLFRRAADMGSIEAQTMLGNIYDEGDGVKESFATARYWYKRAVVRGCPEAAYNLGISYLNRANTRWAVYWLNIAKTQGDDSAIEKLEELGFKR